jgi:hypothetical protein
MVPRLTQLLLILIAGPVSLFGQSTPFAVGERLTYQAEFGVLSAGTSIIQVAGHDTLAGKPTLHLISETSTNSFFDYLYRVRNTIDFWVDAGTTTLQQLIRDIHEGNYHRRDTTTVDLNGQIHTGRGDTLSAEEPVFDPLGAVYHLRTRPLQLGDIIHLKIYDYRRLRDVVVQVDGPIQVKVPAGEFECLILKPAPRDQRQLTKTSGLLRVWLTTDERRLPIRIEQRASFGTMVLKLLEIENGLELRP